MRDARVGIVGALRAPMKIARSFVSLSRLLGAAFVSLGALSLGGCAANASDGDVSSEESSALTSNEQTAYDYFVGKGLTHIQAAAIVGNLMQESGVSPTSVQPGGPGRGIAQWSVGARWNVSTKDNVAWYASTNGGSETSLATQLAFIWYELETFSHYGLAALRAASTISAATIAFQTDFEACGECNESARVTNAQQVLNAFGSGTSSGGEASGGGSTSGSGGSSAGCFSSTLGKEMPADACVQAKSNSAWYQCDDGAWVDRWNDPTPCEATYPL